MKKLFLLGLIWGVTTTGLLAQSSTHALQLNVSGIYQRPDFLLQGPSPSLVLFSESGLRQQVEWTQLRFSSEMDDEKRLNEFYNLIRYEISHRIGAPGERISFYGGLSAGWFIDTKQITPFVPSIFEGYYFGTGLEIKAIPLVLINLNERLYFEFGVPVGLIHATAAYNRTLNPAVRVDNQGRWGTNVNIGGEIGFRAGLGVRL